MSLPAPSTPIPSGAAVVVAAASSTKKPDPDKVRRVAHALTYYQEVWYFLACFIALVTLGNWIGVAYVYFREKWSQGRTHERKKRSSLITRFPLAVVDTFRALAFRWTIPLGTRYTVNVMDVLISAAYATVVFTWSLINSNSLKGVKYDPKYWANVAGNIAASQLPLVAALGMKNNIISFLTGISFDKLNYLHRMTARSICALIWLHAAGRLKLGVHGDQSLSLSYMKCGIMSVVALTILSLVAVRPVRNSHYEIFLISHFVLVFIFVIGAYFHADAFELGRLIWPVFIFWGLDRVLRVLRMLVYNYGYFLPGRSKPFDGVVEVLSPGLIRLKVYRPNFLHWRPGQCVYLTLPGVSSLPLESHPFTISTIDVQCPHKKVENSHLTKELIFLLRVRNGITQRLSIAIKTPVTVFMDGPYGSPPILKGADSALLIAGGSGISFTLPLLLELLHITNVLCKRVTFIWAVREADETKWIANVLGPALQHIPEGLQVDIQIYVTQANADMDDTRNSGDVEKTGSEDVNHSLHNLPGVSIRRVRPDIQHIIATAIHDTSDLLSANVCGASPLTSVTRRALRTPRFIDIMRGAPAVTLHIEAFGNC